MAPSQEPTLFLWNLSAWAAKVTAYFALRGIPHRRCEQPITLPRPDLAALGVNYRRIPVLAIGRDIYCDTLLILEKLEKLYPGEEGGYKKISAANGTELMIEKLLEKWTDAVVFKSAAAVIKADLELMKDPNFQKDRQELWGRPWTKAEQDKLRPAGLANMRAFFGFLEEILGDGREWVLGGKEGPKLADIHSCWIFDWLLLLDSFDADFFNSKIYPKVFSWRDRYGAAIAKAKENAPKATELEGPDAVKQLLAASFEEEKLVVEDDPTGLKEGEEVVMYPSDTGFNRKDGGKLVGLNVGEMVVQTVSKQDGREIRIHYPRWNFDIERADKAATAGAHENGGSYEGTDHAA